MAAPNNRDLQGVWTQYGLQTMAAWMLGGEPLRLCAAALGSGDGTLPQVSQNQAELVEEIWRGPVNAVRINPEDPTDIMVDVVVPNDTGGFWIREWGLFDADGLLVAVGPHAEMHKPLIATGQAAEFLERFHLPVSNSGAIDLTISSQALATIDYTQRITGSFSGLFADIIRLSDRETKTELRLLYNGLRDIRLADRVAALERGGAPGIGTSQAMPPEGVALSKGVTAAPLTLVDGDGVPPARAAIKALLRDWPAQSETTGE